MIFLNSVVVQCCYGRSPFASGDCLEMVPAQLMLEPYGTGDGEELLKVTAVRIDPALGWYVNAGSKHLYCPEHKPKGS